MPPDDGANEERGIDFHVNDITTAICNAETWVAIIMAEEEKIPPPSSFPITPRQGKS